jgi:two-component system, cell cycle sensor histidine kinase and response regulator CckA
MIASSARAVTAQPLPRILLVDDNAAQLKLNRVRLEAAGYSVDTACDADEALRKARVEPPDAIVSDVFMGEVDGFDLCRRVREDTTLGKLPVILLSAHCDSKEDRALSARVGASELVARTVDFEPELAAIDRALKRRPSAIPNVAGADLYDHLLRRNANRITKLINQAQSAEDRYRALFDHANDAIAFVTPEGVVLEANRRTATLLGVEVADIVGRNIRDFSPPGTEESNVRTFLDATATDSGRVGPVPVLRADGSVLLMDFALSTTEIAGKPTVLAIGRDVTDEVEARRAVATAEERYRSLVERMPDVVWMATSDGNTSVTTPNVVRMLGYGPAELQALDVEGRNALIHPDDRSHVLEAGRALMSHGEPFDLEYRTRHKQGHYVWVRNRGFRTYQRDGVRYSEGILSDINDRKLLEETLQQAQRMEAIGQLTGGIAHDFNNILAAILANSHFLLEALGKDDARRQDAEEIRLAAERAASLTRQLLAFSRRQVLRPAIVDLNTSVAGIQKMLCRLIGEDITLTVTPACDLGTVRVDVGQIEQVIMNLAVNARDAMPKGGRLSIETSNVDLGAEYVAGHPPVEPGRYVALTVTDTGLGMDAETKRRLFEPFFTTKELGKGTGLGLSTCYGIVKQSGGHIWVYSELGQGTVFKIYLPRVDGVAQIQEQRAPASRLEGSETVLLVEDDERVRSALTRVLECHGYRALVATDGAEAMTVADTHQGRIDLVLTDVVMPHSNGPEVAEFIRRHRCSKVLFMSGYTEHAALHSGDLLDGQAFIQKPFSPFALLAKLREVLDA